MNRWGRRLLGGTLVLAVGLLCLAPAALAEGEEETGGFGAFRLRGTHGFSILVLANSGPHYKRGEVLIFAGKEGRRVAYFVPARVTATEIEADLGALGAISLRFEGSGPRRRVEASCDEGGATTYQPGLWLGRIEFKGEEGFTRLDATRAPALVQPFLEFGCGLQTTGEVFGPRARGARLIAWAAASGRFLRLQVNQNRPGAPAQLDASLTERGGRMLITREVWDTAPGGSFDFGPRLASATLAPPSPFSGRAHFRRRAEAEDRWSGDLSVDFPGRVDVPLVGPAFVTTLRRAERISTTARRSRAHLPRWPSTKLRPTASAERLRGPAPGG